jgi:hypothetical protein
MKNLALLDHFRLRGPEIVRLYGSDGDGTCGVFGIPSCIDGRPLLVIASSGDGWDHVSVSRRSRCPSWPEMEQVRRLLFLPEEAVMQYHAPIDEYIDGSVHGCLTCLHLWRPHGVAIPKPPWWMVGGTTPAEAEAAAAREKGMSDR